MEHKNPDGAVVNVKIGNYVEIGNDVILNRSPLTYHGKYVANEYSMGKIRIGCEIHSIKEWRDNQEDILLDNNETENQELLKWFIDSVERLQKISPLNMR